MDRMKKVLSKINKKMLLYLLDLMIVFFIISLLLNIFNLAFRNWVYIVIGVIVMLGILIKVVQKFIKLPTDVKGTIGICIGILIFLGVIFSRITLMFLFVILLGLSNVVPSAEHVVEREGQKYVAQVHSGFLNTDVTYYKYINFLIRGNKEVDTEYYNGSYDPIKSKLDREKENSNIETKNQDENNDTNEKLENKTEQEKIKQEEIVIFTQKINESISMRVIDMGNILGQRRCIKIQKTMDNGKTWDDTLKNADGMITVNDGAKVNFINEKVRIY